MVDKLVGSAVIHLICMGPPNSQAKVGCWVLTCLERERKANSREVWPQLIPLLQLGTHVCLAKLSVHVYSRGG